MSSPAWFFPLTASLVRGIACAACGQRSMHSARRVACAGCFRRVLPLGPGVRAPRRTIALPGRMRAAVSAPAGSTCAIFRRGGKAAIELESAAAGTMKNVLVPSGPQPFNVLRSCPAKSAMSLLSTSIITV